MRLGVKNKGLRQAKFSTGKSYGVSTFNSNGYLGANFEEGEEGVLVKKALVAVEGSFKDSKGVEHSFSSDRLETIAAHTNRALESGTVIPVCTDHKKEFDSTVGGIEGGSGMAYTKPIEASDLPNPRASHLLGKIGLFVDGVAVKAANAIEKVKNGIVTSVSMGLNLDPSDHRLIELSLVPIPAIPNMGLFKFGGPDEGNVFSWEELESSEQSLEDLKESYDVLTENLWLLLNNIYSSESIEITDLATLQQYVYSVLNGFSMRVTGLLGLPDASETGMSQDMGNTMMADQTQQMQQAQVQDVANTGAVPQTGAYSRGNQTVAHFSRGRKYYRG